MEVIFKKKFHYCASNKQNEKCITLFWTRSILRKLQWNDAIKPNVRAPFQNLTKNFGRLLSGINVDNSRFSSKCHPQWHSIRYRRVLEYQTINNLGRHFRASMMSWFRRSLLSEPRCPWQSGRDSAAWGSRRTDADRHRRSPSGRVVLRTTMCADDTRRRTPSPSGYRRRRASSGGYWSARGKRICSQIRRFLRIERDFFEYIAANIECSGWILSDIIQEVNQICVGGERRKRLIVV